MTRVYVTKGPDKLMHGPSVPMSTAMQAALRRRAREEALSVAELVRRYVKRGLQDDEANERREVVAAEA